MLGHHLNQSYKRATLIKGSWDGFEMGMAAAFQESGLAEVLRVQVFKSVVGLGSRFCPS